jgi:signal transduction histidine kinase
VFLVEVSASSVTDGEGNIVGKMASFIDITARRELEERILRQERLAVLGQIAGGIVHDLRNPLGWIKGSTYFLETAIQEPDADVTKAVELLKRGVSKSEKIIDGLLSFVRPSSPKQQEVYVNDVAQKALSDMDLPENVQVVQNLRDSLPAISGDPHQLGLVFDNIILNAVQAMSKGGTLTIETGISAGWISVSFADTGVGIPDENLDRIFEPLFTTKDEGIGLGLALIKMLVEGHGGRIEVESALGAGSVFTVCLPEKKDESIL